MLADSGYKSEENFRTLEEKCIEGLVPLGREDRIGPADSAGPATERMERRMRSQRGRTRYKLRKAIAEPPFGWIKRVLGFRSFSLRGLTKGKGEWDLVCMATNLKRMNQKMAWT